MINQTKSYLLLALLWLVVYFQICSTYILRSAWLDRSSSLRSLRLPTTSLMSSTIGGAASSLSSSNEVLHPGEDDGEEGYEDQIEEEEESDGRFKRIAISGFASKENNFASILPFDFFYEHPAFAESLVCIADDSRFARKRFSSPKTVYNGFIDNVEIVEAKNNDFEDYKRALDGVDAWLAFNLTSSLLKDYVQVAIDKKIQRVLFAVAASRNEYGPGIEFPEVTDLLEQHHINYTIVKYIPSSDIKPGPYRIVRGGTVIPRPGEWNEYGTLSPKDLHEILAYLLPMPDSYNQVYGIGVGGWLDENAMAQMRSKGWPKPLQVAQFLHVFMEDIEQQTIEKLDEAETKKQVDAVKKQFKQQLPVK